MSLRIKVFEACPSCFIWVWVWARFSHQGLKGIGRGPWMFVSFVLSPALSLEASEL